MLSATTTRASAASSAPTTASASAAPFKSSISNRRCRAGPPRCIDGRAGRWIARAAPAGGPSGGGGAAPPRTDASSPSAGRGASDRAAVAAAAAAAGALAPSPAPPSFTDDIAVTGIAASFASYEDPADRPSPSPFPSRLLLAAVGAEGDVSLPEEAARLEALLARLRACGGDVDARLAVLEAEPRVIALREATR